MVKNEENGCHYLKSGVMAAFTSDYELALSLQNEEFGMDMKPIPHPKPMTESNEIFIEWKGSDEVALLLVARDRKPPMGDFHLNYDLQRRILYMQSQGRYNVLLKRVGTLLEAVNVVKQVKEVHGYRIIHLEFIGHGDPTSLNLGKEVIRVGRSDSKLKEIFCRLECGALILALSCFSGAYIGEGRDNLITYMAKLARGHQVIGTRAENGPHLSLKVSRARPLRVKYKMGDRNVTVIQYYGGT